MRWGGGGTPSIDEPDKAYPQPVKTDVIIPDEEKVSWNSEVKYYIQKQTALLNEQAFTDNVLPIVVNSNDAEYRGSELPAGYTQIEYLESTGTQWIDTGIKDKTTVGFEIDFTPTYVPNDWYFFGVYKGAVQLNQYTPSGKASIRAYGHSAITSGLLANNVNYKIKTTSIDVKTNEDVLSYGNEVTSKNMNILVFKVNDLNISYAGKYKLYSLKLFDDSTLVRDFIPCYDSNHVLGLYDVVNEKFYTNSGTGCFNIENASTFTYTLQGNGSQANPYKLSSAMDLAYFSYSSNNGTNYANKYFELTKDIVLNDGRFEVDKNHNITYYDGGDGKLFSWSPIAQISNLRFDGKGHKIIGMYTNSPNGVGGLFKHSSGVYADIVENVLIEKMYIVAGWTSVLGKAKTIANSTVISGELISTYDSTGTDIYGIGYAVTIFNCENHANLYAYKFGRLNGIGRATTIELCKNYGNISGGSNYASGIGNATYYKYCENWGNIASWRYPAAFGTESATSTQYYTGCKNFGECKCYDTASSSYYGCLVGLTYGNCYFYDCEQHGKGSNLAFVGFTNDYRGEIEIINSKIYTNKGTENYFTKRQYMKSCKIENCEVIMSENGNESFTCVHTVGSTQTSVSIKNVKCTSNRQYFACFVPKGSIKSVISIKNILHVNVNPGSSPTSSLVGCKIVDGVVVVSKGNHSSCSFIGSNFSDFYYSWKDNNIGLNCFDGNGSFQGKVTEEWLLGKGFSKIG